MIVHVVPPVPPASGLSRRVPVGRAAARPGCGQVTIAGPGTVTCRRRHELACIPSE